MITLALATIRATRLLILDTITDPVRKRLFTRHPATITYQNQESFPGYPWQPVKDETGKATPNLWYREPTSFGVWASKMLGCPRWCASIWAAIAVLACNRTPGLRWIPRALALSEIVAYLWYASEEGEPTSLRRAQQRMREAQAAAQAAREAVQGVS